MKRQLLVDVEQISRSARRGVILCLPRDRLQRWLLTEGRAWRAGCGDADGDDVLNDSRRLWLPRWVENGIDAIPPVLPGREAKDGVDGNSAGGSASVDGGDIDVFN